MAMYVVYTPLNYCYNYNFQGTCSNTLVTCISDSETTCRFNSKIWIINSVASESNWKSGGLWLYLCLTRFRRLCNSRLNQSWQGYICSIGFHHFRLIGHVTLSQGPNSIYRYMYICCWSYILVVVVCLNY